MASTITIAELPKHLGETVRLEGWVYNTRSSGKIRFIILRDGTGFLQTVFSQKDVTPEEWDNTNNLPLETSIEIEGEGHADKRAPGGVELVVKGISVLAMSQSDYPITLKEHGVDFLMEHRHLWLRTPRQRAIMVIRAQVMRAIREFLDNDGFLETSAPILTPSAAEETSQLFETQYFDEKAYLSQSGQLYAEATAMALGKVYSFGPTFRAEKSKTRRHLIEFWMVEPEAAFLDFEGNLVLQERFVSHLVKRVLENCEAELNTLGRDIEKLTHIVPPFPRVTYDEAVKMLSTQPGLEMEWGDDPGAPQETFLSNQFDRPVFVTHYPAKAKAFYMKPDPNRPEVVLAADLLASEGYGEIIGGSQRIDDLQLMEQRLKDFDLPEAPYEWYLDLRRFGSVPHSGFGLGIERTLAWICGLEHIRETIPFPRLLGRIYP
jgi:asparaginyl-tRNA synthetase